MPKVPTRICELVETFDQHVEAYRSSQYNEAQVRREFIDTFYDEFLWPDRRGNKNRGRI